jgi:hypothetical protein
MANAETEFANTNHGLETEKQAQMEPAKEIPRKAPREKIPLFTLSHVPLRYLQVYARSARRDLRRPPRHASSRHAILMPSSNRLTRLHCRLYRACRSLSVAVPCSDMERVVAFVSDACRRRWLGVRGNTRHRPPQHVDTELPIISV